MYLTMDGRPWLPVMGEFHYSRVPAPEWEEELLKMKSAGVQIVSTYVIWIHHEEIRGKFDWAGQKDLRHFAELCRRHGLYLLVRVGPWVHGEVRNGGLPDWVIKDGPTRRNDPAFMSSVAGLYAQIGAQLNGLLWKDRGPVIGVQLENEYSARGPLEGERYILALKRLAIKGGLDVPLYTVTGWDNAVVPKGEVLPVFGGYPDAPWDSSITALSPNEVYMFRFRNRVAGDTGDIDETRETNASGWNTPFLTAELGGGVQDTYHRRPLIEPDDIAAMLPVMLGSGANLYGYYMFQGGENPDGRLTTLQESQATGYPTDVPMKSYDFQAPLSEFGEERASFRKLKVFHYFLNDFGSELAQMSVHVPDIVPRSADDLNVVRASVRSNGERGFLFVNNYVRGATMPARKSAQFEVLLPDSKLNIPKKPIDIPSGSYFIWPFNLQLGASTLKYATAQLFTRFRDSEGEVFLFVQTPGIPSTFVLKNEPELDVSAGRASVEKHPEGITISQLQTGLDHEVRIRLGQGPEVRLILLSTQEAENAWKTNVDGSPHLLVTDRGFFADEKSFVLLSRGDPHCSFTIYPPSVGKLRLASGGELSLSSAGKLNRFAASVPEERIAFDVKKLRDAGEVSPVQLGSPLSWRPKGVAIAPSETSFDSAAKWAISVPRLPQSETLSNLFLKVDYTGDVARLSSNGKVLTDNFYNGAEWTIGLRRFMRTLADGPLEISILPLREDAPIFIEKRFRPSFKGREQVEDLKRATLLPEYKFLFQIGAD